MVSQICHRVDKQDALKMFCPNKGQTEKLIGGYYKSLHAQIHDQWKDPT
jgi:hypothetical protein